MFLSPVLNKPFFQSGLQFSGVGTNPRKQPLGYKKGSLSKTSSDVCQQNNDPETTASDDHGTTASDDYETRQVLQAFITLKYTIIGFFKKKPDGQDLGARKFACWQNIFKRLRDYKPKKHHIVAKILQGPAMFDLFAKDIVGQIFLNHVDPTAELKRKFLLEQKSRSKDFRKRVTAILNKKAEQENQLNQHPLKNIVFQAFYTLKSSIKRGFNQLIEKKPKSSCPEYVLNRLEKYSSKKNPIINQIIQDSTIQNLLYEDIVCKIEPKNSPLTDEQRQKLQLEEKSRSKKLQERVIAILHEKAPQPSEVSSVGEPAGGLTQLEALTEEEAMIEWLFGGNLNQKDLEHIKDTMKAIGNVDTEPLTVEESEHESLLRDSSYQKDWEDIEAIIEALGDPDPELLTHKDLTQRTGSYYQNSDAALSAYV